MGVISSGKWYTYTQGEELMSNEWSEVKKMEEKVKNCYVKNFDY